MLASDFLLSYIFRYSTPGLIHVPPSDLEFPVLFQCSSECRCTNCGNQWAKSGSEYPVGVYFVSESMGFDLRSMCMIPEGAFVGVYAGRVQDVKTTCEVYFGCIQSILFILRIIFLLYLLPLQ